MTPDIDAAWERLRDAASLPAGTQEDYERNMKSALASLLDGKFNAGVETGADVRQCPKCSGYVFTIRVGGLCQCPCEDGIIIADGSTP